MVHMLIRSGAIVAVVAASIAIGFGWWIAVVAAFLANWAIDDCPLLWPSPPGNIFILLIKFFSYKL
jgi:hypothetical protein